MKTSMLTERSSDLHSIITGLVNANAGLPDTLRVTGYYPHFICDRCMEMEGTFSVQDTTAPERPVFRFLCEVCLDITAEAEVTYLACASIGS